MWGIAARAVAAAVLVLTVVMALIARDPTPGDTDDLLSGLRSGRVDAVAYDADPRGFTVRWSDGWFSLRETEFDFAAPLSHGSDGHLPGPGFDPATEFRRVVEAATPAGGHVSVDTYTSARRRGPDDLLMIPALLGYLPWLWLTLAAFLIGFGLLVSMVYGGPPQLMGRGWWFWLSVLTGFGFLAYLLFERRLGGMARAAPREDTIGRRPTVAGWAIVVGCWGVAIPFVWCT
ncbi:hypothetical protein [Embleya sp. NPDC020630]|uniref:hypothetical protein n=1 Tax=Embleya sp. NPDC020630 TaxID=3363979 RepID=UPI0037B870F5